MNALKTSTLGLLGSLMLTACRQSDPVGDPRTPANTPVPTIDRSGDPKGSDPVVADAGASLGGADDLTVSSLQHSATPARAGAR